MNPHTVARDALKIAKHSGSSADMLARQHGFESIEHLETAAAEEAAQDEASSAGALNLRQQARAARDEASRLHAIADANDARVRELFAIRNNLVGDIAKDEELLATLQSMLAADGAEEARILAILANNWADYAFVLQQADPYQFARHQSGFRIITESRLDAIAQKKAVQIVTARLEETKARLAAVVAELTGAGELPAAE